MKLGELTYYEIEALCKDVKMLNSNKNDSAKGIYYNPCSKCPLNRQDECLIWDLRIPKHIMDMEIDIDPKLIGR